MRKRRLVMLALACPLLLCGCGCLSLQQSTAANCVTPAVVNEAGELIADVGQRFIWHRGAYGYPVELAATIVLESMPPQVQVTVLHSAATERAATVDLVAPCSLLHARSHLEILLDGNWRRAQFVRDGHSGITVSVDGRETEVSLAALRAVLPGEEDYED